MSEKVSKESQYMVSHPGPGLDPPIGSDRESGCDMASKPYSRGRGESGLRYTSSSL